MLMGLRAETGVILGRDERTGSSGNKSNVFIREHSWDLIEA
jgi:hypothetical protein